MLDQWPPWSGDPAQRLIVNEAVQLALTWWTVREHVMQGVRLQAIQLHTQIFIDSSLEGWGVLVGKHGGVGVWDSN